SIWITLRIASEQVSTASAVAAPAGKIVKLGRFGLGTKTSSNLAEANNTSRRPFFPERPKAGDTPGRRRSASTKQVRERCESAMARFVATVVLPSPWSDEAISIVLGGLSGFESITDVYNARSASASGEFGLLNRNFSVGNVPPAKFLLASWSPPFLRKAGLAWNVGIIEIEEMPVHLRISSGVWIRFCTRSLTNTITRPPNSPANSAAPMLRKR